MDKTSSDAAGTSGSLPGNKSEQVAKLTAEQRQILRDEKEREAEINDAFGYHDLKRQGKLSLNHLDDVLSMLGITLPPNEKRTPLLRLADPAGTGFFNASSLKKLVKEVRGVTTKEEDIITTYRLFDKQNKGYFTREELKAVLSRFQGKAASEGEIEQIMTMAEPAKAGEKAGELVITRDTFISLYK